MKRAIATALAVLLLVLSFSGLAEEVPTITINGYGTVTVPPDKAVITFGVRMVSSDIASAQTYVNTHLGKCIDKLRAMGVTEDDIQTSHISIEEDYSSSDILSEPEYAVENSVSVVISDVNSAGRYIDAVFGAGANRFTGIQFIASDTEAAKEQAMSLAYSNALSRARKLAACAGMKLGALLTITDVDDPGYTSRSNGLFAKTEGAMDSFANQVYTSDVDITAGVKLVYELQPIDRRTSNRRN